MSQKQIRFGKIFSEDDFHSFIKQFSTSGILKSTYKVSKEVYLGGCSIESLQRHVTERDARNGQVFWGLYADKGIKKLDNNYPLLWSTSSGTYGSHTMAVCGYKYYSKTSGWWIFKVTSYKLFYELRDGHSTDPRFYDILGHVGFSSIISLD